MSYDIYDAWLEEQGWGRFDFELFELDRMPLRSGVDYFPSFVTGRFSKQRLNRCQQRLGNAFGSRDPTILAAALEAAYNTVWAARERMESEARSAFESGESLQSLCEGYGALGSDEPARTLLESLDEVGPEEGFTGEQLCAAVGLWLLGETVAAEESAKAEEVSEWAETEALELMAEAEWYRGRAEVLRDKGAELSRRNKRAAQVRHSGTNSRRKAANAWYLTEGRALPTKAAAAAAVAKQASISFEVAKRWVTAFERAATRIPPRAAR